MTVPAPRPIRVVHLVTALNVGGLEQVVLQMVRHAERSVVLPSVICLEEPGDLLPSFVREEVTVTSIAAPRAGFPRRVRLLADVLRQRQADVLHTHNPGPHLHGAAAKLIGAVPVLIHTKHGRNYPGNRRAVLTNRIASALSDAVVAVSRDAARVAREIEGVPARKISTIHNGVEVAFTKRTTRVDPTRAICVARLHPVKDHVTLLRAARLIADVEPAFRLELVGDGPSRPALASLVADLGLIDHVRFLGTRSDVLERLRGAGLFLLSSTTEGISLTLLEAMAVGLPVVATNVGGTPEVVRDGVSGLLVPPGDPAAMASAVLRLIHDAGACRTMGEEGRGRAQDEFGVCRMVRAYEELYLRAAAKTMGARAEASRRRADPSQRRAKR